MQVRVQGSQNTHDINWYGLSGGMWHYLSKWQMEMLLDLVILLQIHLKMCACAKMCMTMSLGILLWCPTIKHPSGHIHKIELWVTIKKNEVDLTIDIKIYPW